jgi:hypothetical protein
VSWTDPTPADIKASASLLALALPSISPFLFNPNATFFPYYSPSDRIDVGVWFDGLGRTLILAANLNYDNTTLDLSGVPGVPPLSPGGGGWVVDSVLNNSGAVLDNLQINFQSVGTGAFILSDSPPGSHTPNSSASSSWTRYSVPSFYMVGYLSSLLIFLAI